MQQLLRWFYAAGTAGAARNAGRVLDDHHSAEAAVDALVRRLPTTRRPKLPKVA